MGKLLLRLPTGKNTVDRMQLTADV
uniref:Uncharacterized protein n=1 Tax=Arundo donax TaxID=35708 RepID=A0A0A8YY80_ARUDO